MLFIPVISAVLLAVLMSSLASASYDFFSYKPLLSASTPSITNTELYPPKVKEGDVLLIKTEIRDIAGISSATAEIDTEAGKDKVNLNLIKGSKQSGTWRADWIAHSTKNQKWYNLSIIAENIVGKATILQTQYFDPVQNHSAGEVTAGTFDIGDFVFQRNFAVVENITANETLVLRQTSSTPLNVTGYGQLFYNTSGLMLRYSNGSVKILAGE